MDIKLDIAPEHIETAVRDAIIKSSIGDQISVAIAKALTDWHFKEAVEGAVRSLVFKMATEMVSTDPSVAAKVKAALDESVDEVFIKGAIGKLVESAKRGY